jgi:hypothetical protein
MAAPRKQAMPRKRQQTGQWLGNLASTFILTRAASRRSAHIPVEAAGDLGPERSKGGNTKIGETDPASCRKAREARSRF